MTIPSKSAGGIAIFRNKGSKMQLERSKNTRVLKNCRCKPIIQYDLEGNFIKEWRCALDIEKELGYNASAIGKCCKHLKRYKSHHSFKWEYK